jgi:hypothetical protein
VWEWLWRVERGPRLTLSDFTSPSSSTSSASQRTPVRAPSAGSDSTPASPASTSNSLSSSGSSAALSGGDAMSAVPPPPRTPLVRQLSRLPSSYYLSGPTSNSASASASTSASVSTSAASASSPVLRRNQSIGAGAGARLAEGAAPSALPPAGVLRTGSLSRRALSGSRSFTASNLHLDSKHSISKSVRV